MATNKLEIRPRIRIFESVDASLYEFAMSASADEFNSAILSGLRLWMLQKEMRAIGKPFPMVAHPVDIPPVPVPVREVAPPTMVDLGLVSLDLHDLDLQDTVVHRAEGG
jgi:hypothetical protein